MAQVNVYKLYAQFIIKPTNRVEKLYTDILQNTNQCIGELSLTSDVLLDAPGIQLVIDKLNEAAVQSVNTADDALKIVDLIYSHSYNDEDKSNDEANKN